MVMTLLATFLIYSCQFLSLWPLHKPAKIFHWKWHIKSSKIARQMRWELFEQRLIWNANGLAFSSTFDDIFLSTIQHDISSTFGGAFWLCSAETPVLLKEVILKVLQKLGELNIAAFFSLLCRNGRRSSRRGRYSRWIRIHCVFVL